MYKGESDAGPGPELMGADTLIGNEVYNLQDEMLGDIKEIMLDMRSGQVAYAVLSYGGFLGLGEKLFAVPWSALTLDTENKRFVLSGDKERLAKAPGFDRNTWPNMADQAAIFADVLESTREPGTSRFSASGVADILGLQQQDLAELAGVHRNTLRTHPESPRLQSALRDLMRVLSAAAAVQPDPQRAIFLVKNEPIPAFRHKTLLQLVQEGRTEDAIGYLESISAGFVG
jgi:sporulation protein YlmC with PRC-barrel domain